MDVTEPELIWVDNRCYRVYTGRNEEEGVEEKEEKEEKGEEAAKKVVSVKQDIDVPVCTNEFDKSIEIIELDREFKHSFYLPKALHPLIIGTNHANIVRVERDTRTNIEIVDDGSHENIEIYGENKGDVTSARYRLELLAETSRIKLHHTHFLSIPLNKENIIQKFNLFKTDVLEKYAKPEWKIDELLFQTPIKLHLTIAMLKLLDEDEKKQALEALAKCKKDIIDPMVQKGAINIKLHGVACMNDDPTKVSVLYAQIYHNEKLQELVEKVSGYFVEKGLSDRQYKKVKLHCTLMNSNFKSRINHESKKTFNAVEILKAHKNTPFGNATLKQIDISELKSATKDNYYKALSSISV